MAKTHTMVRVSMCDLERVKSHVARLNATNKYCRYSQRHVISLALDSYDALNKTDEASSETDKKNI